MTLMEEQLVTCYRLFAGVLQVVYSLFASYLQSGIHTWTFPLILCGLVPVQYPVFEKRIADRRTDRRTMDARMDGPTDGWANQLTNQTNNQPTTLCFNPGQGFFSELNNFGQNSN